MEQQSDMSITYCNNLDNSMNDMAHYYHEFHIALRKRIRYIMGNVQPEDVEDVLQDTFLKACRYWHKAANHEHPYGYLYAVATTTAIDASRKRTAHPSDLSLEYEQQGSESEHSHDQSQDWYLDPRQRDPLEIVVRREQAQADWNSLSEQQRGLLYQEAFIGPVEEREKLYETMRLAKKRMQRRAKREEAMAS